MARKASPRGWLQVPGAGLSSGSWVAEPLGQVLGGSRRVFVEPAPSLTRALDQRIATLRRGQSSGLYINVVNQHELTMFLRNHNERMTQVDHVRSLDQELPHDDERQPARCGQ
jgi:hypothetical protein